MPSLRLLLALDIGIHDIPPQTWRLSRLTRHTLHIDLPKRRSNAPTLKQSLRGVLWNDDDISFEDIS